jgi:hypothetical protein
LFLSNSINGLSHSYTTGGSAEIITSTNGLYTNYIGTNTDNDFSLAVNAIRHLTIKKTTGYIGVGTNLPNRELEVSEQSVNCLRLSNSGCNSYLDMIINNQGILTLTLNGPSIIYLQLNDTYNELGITAKDLFNTNIIQYYRRIL